MSAPDGLTVFDRVLARLQSSADPDDVVIGAALADLRDGVPLSRAFDLPPGWRDAGRARARDVALDAGESCRSALGRFC